MPFDRDHYEEQLKEPNVKIKYKLYLKYKIYYLYSYKKF